MQEARGFPVSMCPASAHTKKINAGGGEGLLLGWAQHMLIDRVLDAAGVKALPSFPPSCFLLSCLSASCLPAAFPPLSCFPLCCRPFACCP